MSWTCPTRIERRTPGAQPRFRLRFAMTRQVLSLGEQRFGVTHAIRWSRLCIAPIEALERNAISQARPPGTLPNASQAADDRAQYFARPCLGRSPCSPWRRTCHAMAQRRWKRRNAPRTRFLAAFSLVEVLASLFILTLSAVGITAAWRLADYQELLTRVDRRAERILRQYYELQTFAPPDSRPFTVNESSQQTPITGYLYHPRLISGQTGTGSFGNLIPFSISMTNGTAAGTSQLILSYTVPSYGTQTSRQVIKTVVLNP
jgi:hypothetical protein